MSAPISFTLKGNSCVHPLASVMLPKYVPPLKFIMYSPLELKPFGPIQLTELGAATLVVIKEMEPSLDP